MRRAVITALGNYADDGQVAIALEDVFRNDSSYYARAEAVKSIAGLGAPNAYDICVEALKVASHQDVIRCAALSGLGRLKDPRGVDHALKLAAYGQPPRVRTSAISLLTGLAAHAPKRKKEIRERLVALLEDPHFRVRSAAISSLGRLGDPKTLKALEASLEWEPHFRHRDAAREAIRKIRIKGAK